MKYTITDLADMTNNEPYSVAEYLGIPYGEEDAPVPNDLARLYLISYVNELQEQVDYLRELVRKF
jgi:hypothetical protein